MIILGWMHAGTLCKKIISWLWDEVFFIPVRVRDQLKTA